MAKIEKNVGSANEEKKAVKAKSTKTVSKETKKEDKEVKETKSKTTSTKKTSEEKVVKESKKVNPISSENDNVEKKFETPSFKEKSVEIEEGIKAKLEANPAIASKFEQIVSVTKLMEAGAHIGLTSKRWNPKMKKYVYAKKGRNHIIDIFNTLVGLSNAYHFLKELGAKNKTALFLGTKTFIVKKQIKDQAKRVNAFYVNQRWLGGTLTNLRTIMNSTKKLNELAILQKNGEIEKFTKKEQIEKIKEFKRLSKFFGGIRTMTSLPDVLIVNDPVEEKNAIAEAKKLGIKVIAICNTNANPEGIDIVIPANNYSIKAVYLIIGLLADAIAIGQGKPTQFIGKKDEEIILPQTYIQK